MAIIANIRNSNVTILAKDSNQFEQIANEIGVGMEDIEKIIMTENTSEE